MSDNARGFILRASPGKDPQLIDTATDKPVDRVISRVLVESRVGEIVKATVECVDIGVDVTLRSDQIKFRVSQVVQLDPLERINVIAALRALKVVSNGGDSRTAMLQVMDTVNSAKESLMSVAKIDQLIIQLLNEEAVEPDEDKPTPEPAKPTPSPAPPTPEVKAAEGPDHDPLKGAALVTPVMEGDHGPK